MKFIFRPFLILIVLFFGFLINSRGQDTLIEGQQEKEGILESNQNLFNDEAIQQEELEIKSNQLNEDFFDINDPAVDLNELTFLSVQQKESFLRYRKLMGAFICKEELQSIPYWDVELIQKIYPRIRAGRRDKLLKEISERFQNGHTTLSFQSSYQLQQSAGFTVDTPHHTKPFLGNPLAYSMKYNYRFRNSLQVGFLLDKDPGEVFFCNKPLQFEFFSGHIFMKNIGRVKALVLGDYVVNIGQGLFQWQSLANHKGSNVLQIKRESETIKPYNSFKEFGFFRGAAFNLGVGNWDCAFFVSKKKMDANLANDSFDVSFNQVSSIINSGLHRTYDDLLKKNSEGLTVLGTSITKNNINFKFGVTSIVYHFDFSFQNKNSATDIFDFRGNQLFVLGGNYEYSYKNFHFFGEGATESNHSKAFISGLITAVSKNLDIAFLHRDISRSFQTFYSNSFVENWDGRNEIGNYLGISFASLKKWKVDVYFDKFKFHWLVNGGNAIANGNEYLISAGKFFGKESSLQFLVKKKSIMNVADGVYNKTQSAKVTMKMRLGVSGEWTQSIQMGSFLIKSETFEDGLLISSEFKKKMANNKTQGILHFVFFDTDSYQSKLFLPEWDGMSGGIGSLFYDKGLKIRFLVNEKLNKFIELGLKISHIYYFNRKSISSGYDLIKSNKKTLINLRMSIKF